MRSSNLIKADLKDLIQRILTFRDDRDWAQFHQPKDLAVALSIEASELLELFLWKTPEEVRQLEAKKRPQLSDELADVAWYVLLLSHELKIDLAEAILTKLEKNAAKYPIEKARSRSAKYNELD